MLQIHSLLGIWKYSCGLETDESDVYIEDNEI
jgi:hypothetical protein